MTRATIHERAFGELWWETALRPIPPALRPFVRARNGYVERSAGPLARRELPGPSVVVILELGPPILVDGVRHAGGFVAGMSDRSTLTAHDGFQRGIQLDLTPIGARRLLGVPMSELTDRVVSFDDLLPGERGLAERLAELPSWDLRFDLVDALLARRIGEARVATDVVGFAVGRIEAHGGRLPVSALARELGYSHKHLITLFRDQVGVPPKLLSQLVRFDRLVKRLREGGGAGWSELAYDLGYADQAHLVRDVRRFTGVTPTETRALLVALAGATP